MMRTAKRCLFTILSAGLALLLSTQTAHAQRRGALVQQQYGQQGRTYGFGQYGFQWQFSASYFQPQLYNQSYNRPYINQPSLYALQQQHYALNALPQYVFEAQLTGTDPDEALQAALLAIQLNQLNAARLQNAQRQVGR
jgi:hypothetical protein